MKTIMSVAELLLGISTPIPVPILTKRLSLRPFADCDAKSMSEMLADDETTKWMGGTRTAAEASASVTSMRDSFNARGWGTLAVTLREDSGCIGYCGVRPLPLTNEVEIAFSLLKSHWGVGLATEASVAYLNLAFDILPIESVVATVYPQNSRCIGVLDKLSMRKETVVFGIWPKPMALLYRVKRNEWLERRTA